MPSITIVLTPQVIALSIFPELKSALREAISRVAGDMISSERVKIDLQAAENPNSVEIFADIDLDCRPPLSIELCRCLADEALALTAGCVATNYPGGVVEIRTFVLAI